MNRCSFFCAFAIGLIGSTAAAETTNETPAPSNQNQGGVVDIPLDEVWAFRMPGTRDVEAMTRDSHSLLFNQIRGALSTLPEKGSKAEPSFVVVGDDVAALKAAKEVLADDKPPRTSFRSDEELHVFFFSRQCFVYVQLDSIQRSKSNIEIRYSFVPHDESVMTEHFALIPLGKLPRGKYRIDIIRSPTSPKLIAQGLATSDAVADSTVCKSSEFEVTN
jgi:hypothetical protein